MAIIDVVKFEGAPQVFAWKYPEQELGTSSRLIVGETQEAILFKGGKALDLFGPGQYTLETQNIPVLQSLINLPFGGQSPFTAEVWFVNKIHTLDVKWGTSTPLMLQDPKYQIILSVRSYGQFGMKIEDSRKFLLKLIGTLPSFGIDELRKHFRGLLMMNIHEIISSYLVHKKISILEINAYQSEIAKHVGERIAPVFEEYGIKLLHFFVDSINTPDDEPATVRLKEALAKKAEMDIMGYTYQQDRSYNMLEGTAKDEDGTASGTMGAGLGQGMDVGVDGAAGDPMSGLTLSRYLAGSETSGLSRYLAGNAYKSCLHCGKLSRQDASFCIACGHRYGSPAPSAGQREETVCNICGNSFPGTAKFCPHCGDAHNPCRACGTDNPEDAAACVKCGYALQAGTCRECGERVPSAAKFCMNCGTGVDGAGGVIERG